MARVVVAHVVPAVSVEASGPSYSVPSLCAALAAHGVDVSIECLAWSATNRTFPFRVEQHPFWRWPRSLGVSPSLEAALRRDAATANIMHNHGLWMMPNVYPAWAVDGTRCRLVTSPRGTFSKWALKRSWVKKKIFWFALQRDTVRRSACLHATSESEARDIRDFGIHTPIAVIPNGIDVPAEPNSPSNGRARRHLLFLSRIHPVKGIDDLLKAWRAVQDSASDWDLDLVGPDFGDGTIERLKGLATALGCARVSFHGPAYGADKERFFRSSDLFVLPSRSENFAGVVAEALSYGVPAVVSHGAPWKGLLTHDCGWWIPNGDAPLAECLRQVLTLSSDELRLRGLRGREWMRRDFSWARVGAMMSDTYRWLLGGGAPPAWVDVASVARGARRAGR